MAASKSVASPFALAQSAMEYWLDAWQRGVLFWDVLHERGNRYLEHTRSGKPPVLVFDYEIVVDGRTLEQPVNYALARIVPPAGCPAADPRKRAFVVIDPRAGHGPGIGGFKIDSEIGIALQQGHPCYFVTFFPEPVPGQTIEAVARAEGVFLEQVNALHPEAEGKPFVIGNCQGGWALMMLAAAAPHLFGPILLAGSPISYWAGVEGKNPMRYSGGLLGGTWLASLAGDLGNGRFDGAYLVNNFEQLDPANTYWSKLHGLYAKVDTERERFLEFERWWGGHFLLNKAEMEWITQNLFVGNRLTAGEVVTANGRVRVDLRNIRSPIVVFASWGDNITPPQQALGWIADLYDSVDEIRLNEQTIVYCLHEKVGHLGIFVSAGVARKQTDELVGALDLIDTLPPGLYEALIEDTHPEMHGLEYVEGRYLIRFVPRTVADIDALDDGRSDERAFEVVKRVAETNQGIYDTFVSPWVRAMSSETSAETLRRLNPARVERWLLSDLNPAMSALAPLAAMVRAQRRPASPDNPFAQAERQVSAMIERSLDAYRDSRDALQEQTFKAIYESPWFAALVGLDGQNRPRRGLRSPGWEHDELQRMKRAAAEAQFESGTVLDGWVRMLAYAGHDAAHGFDERPFNMMRRMIAEMPPQARPSHEALKATMKRQAFVLALDAERAIAALPTLLPEVHQRRQALEAARLVVGARGAPSEQQEQRFSRLEAILGLAAPVRVAKQPG